LNKEKAIMGEREVVGITLSRRTPKPEEPCVGTISQQPHGELEDENQTSIRG
jgi:hypothetical protein